MHAVLPHRVVLHVHCVNTIAWAVRQDAPAQLEHQLEVCAGSGFRTCLRACRLPGRSKRFYPPPLTPTYSYWATTVWSSAEMIAARSKISCPEVERRLAICPRQAHPADYAALSGDCRRFTMGSAG